LIELVISTPVAIAAARPSFTPIEAATETAKVALSPKLIKTSLQVFDAATLDWFHLFLSGFTLSVAK
jgi:hypothetical protein